MAARFGWILGLCIAMAPGLARAAEVVDVVKDFGAKGDGVTDDWEAIQRAMGWGADNQCSTKGREVVIPKSVKNTYVISQPIRLCSNVTLRVEPANVRIFFTGDVSDRPDYTGVINKLGWPMNGAVLAGNMTTELILRLPLYSLQDPIQTNQRKFRLAAPGDSNAFVAGDVVSLETDDKYRINPASGERPYRLFLATITSVAADGTVTIDRPCSFSARFAHIRKLTNGSGASNWPTMLTASGKDTKMPAFMTVNSKILGGVWIAGNGAPWTQAFQPAGGALDSEFLPLQVEAGFGNGYGNLFQNVIFGAEYEKIYTTAIELAFGSNLNTVRIPEIEFVGQPTQRAPTHWDMAVDEGSHDNIISVGSVVDNNNGLVNEIIVPSTQSLSVKAEFQVCVADGNDDPRETECIHVALNPQDVKDRNGRAIADLMNADTSFQSAGFVAIGNPNFTKGNIILYNKLGRRFRAFAKAPVAGGYAPFAFPTDILTISNAWNNKIEIRRLEGIAITGVVVNIADARCPAGCPISKGNAVSVDDDEIRIRHELMRATGTAISTNNIQVKLSGYGH